MVCRLQQELAAIFKKIGDKQTCSIGLYELYRITQLYPKVILCMSFVNVSPIALSLYHQSLSSPYLFDRVKWEMGNCCEMLSLAMSR